MKNDLKYTLTLDEADYVSSMRRARSEGQRFRSANAKAAQSTTPIASGLGKIGPLAAKAFVASQVLSFGRALFDSAARVESLEAGLAAVTKESGKLDAQLIRLKEVAKNPGLGFREALQGSINLQAAGFAARDSERMLGAFGNALATVGKGKADLDGVVTALSQMQAKGKVSAEEINQIAERVPQIRAVMKEAFGTADTTKLQKAGISVEKFVSGITSELEQLPKAAAGMQNSVDNLGDAWQDFTATIGKPLGKVVAVGLKGATAYLNAEVTKWKNIGALFTGDFFVHQKKLLAEASQANPEYLRRVAALAKEKAEAEAKAARELEFQNRQLADQIARETRIAQLREQQAEAARKAALANKEAIRAASEGIIELRSTDEQNIERKIKRLEAKMSRAASYEEGQAFDARRLKTDGAFDYDKAKAFINRNFNTEDNNAARIVAEALEARERLIQQSKASQEPDALTKAVGTTTDADRQKAIKEAKSAFQVEMEIMQAKAKGNDALVKHLEDRRDLMLSIFSIMRQQGLSEREALGLAQQKARLIQQIEDRENQKNEPKKKRGLLGVEASLRSRYNRMSDFDKAQAGSFERWVSRNPLDRSALASVRRKQARENAMRSLAEKAKQFSSPSSSGSDTERNKQTQLLERTAEAVENLSSA